MLGYLVALLILGGIYALLTISLDLQYGHTGLVNFGLVGFFAVGAYGSALVALAGYPIAVGFAVGICSAALLALPIGGLALRLRDDYFAIVTLGFSEVVRLVIVNEEWLTKGGLGLPGVPRPFAQLGVGGAEAAYLALVVACNVIVVLVIRRVVGSPFGRLLQAIRDNETTVVSLGKSPPGAKVRALVIGAAIAGLAGTLNAHLTFFIGPQEYGFDRGVEILTMTILGGINSLFGPVLGGIIVTLLPELLRSFKDYRAVANGLILVLIVLFLPKGLWNPAWMRRVLGLRRKGVTP